MQDHCLCSARVTRIVQPSTLAVATSAGVGLVLGVGSIGVIQGLIFPILTGAAAIGLLAATWYGLIVMGEKRQPKSKAQQNLSLLGGCSKSCGARWQ